MKSITLFSHFAKIFFLTDFKENDLINYLDKINLPMLSNCQKQICAAIITEKEFYGVPRSIENDKTLGNDGLSKEFYEVSINDVFI